MKLEQYLLYALSAGIFIYGSQNLIRLVLNKLFQKTLKTGTIMLSDSGHKDNTELQNEVLGLKAVEYKKEELRIITIIISLIEFISFVAATTILTRHYHDDFYVISSLIKIIGAWFAIKTLGNYSQWSGSILGRATFYIFFIGTSMNIGLALVLAVLILNIK